MVAEGEIIMVDYSENTVQMSNTNCKISEPVQIDTFQPAGHLCCCLVKYMFNLELETRKILRKLSLACTDIVSSPGWSGPCYESNLDLNDHKVTNIQSPARVQDLDKYMVSSISHTIDLFWTT